MAVSDRAASVTVAPCVDEQILSLSREQYRSSQPSADGQLYDKIVVAAAVLRQGSVSRLLLLKRAAHETYFPNVFEIPGGNVDPQDPTLRHALVREVREETGLDVTEIVAELKPITYTTEKTVVNDAGQPVQVSKSAIQLNYVVSVLDGDVQLNPLEHSESAWATKEEADALDITSEMREVVKEAFGWAAGRL